MFYDNSPSSVKCIREISICAVRKLSRMIRKEILQGTSSSYPDSAEYIANLLALSLSNPLLQPHLQQQYNLCKSISGFPTDWPCGLCCRVDQPLASFKLQFSETSPKRLYSEFYHDDVIKWKYFPRYWPFVRGIHRSPMNSPYKSQWHGALMFRLICARIKGWVNNREAGDLRRHRSHYDVISMHNGDFVLPCLSFIFLNLLHSHIITMTICLCLPFKRIVAEETLSKMANGFSWYRGWMRNAARVASFQDGISLLLFVTFSEFDITPILAYP